MSDIKRLVMGEWDDESCDISGRLRVMLAGKQPRLFVIEYDHAFQSKKAERSRNWTHLGLSLNEKQRYWGTYYPDSCGITLSNGMIFVTLSMMEHYFEETGHYNYWWLDSLPYDGEKPTQASDEGMAREQTQKSTIKSRAGRRSTRSTGA